MAKDAADKSLATKAVNLKGKKYVLVSDRVIYFNETYPNGAIDTRYTLNGNTYEFRAVVTPDISTPERTFSGHSQATIGDGMVNKTSAMENCETSAVGRALAMMGIGVIDSIASVDEMHKAQGSQGTPTVKLATAKQVAWLRQEARKISKLDDLDENDAWIKDVLTVFPDQVPLNKVAAAIERIRTVGTAMVEEATTKALDELYPDAEKIDLTDTPY